MDPPERHKKTPRKYSNNHHTRRKTFWEERQSYMTKEEIMRREMLSSNMSDRVTLRHESQRWIPEHDTTDLLDKQTRVRLEWKNVSVEIVPKRSKLDMITGKPVKEPIELLHDVSGYVKPGELFAIIGPTGSGKTTLLKTLAGKFAGKVYGNVLANGMNRDERWRRVVSFIECKPGDLLPGQTVLESIEFVAELSVPKRYGEEEKARRIRQVIKLMGLGGIKNYMIGGQDSSQKGISSGERKRLSIAHELLREPKILFLDEPTSGLDATSAKCMMSLLHQLAIIDSLTIVLTVQQPRMSVLSKFSKILLLHEGSSVFCGNIDDAMEYFDELGYHTNTDDNPVEYMLDAVAGRKVSTVKTLTADQFKQHWKANSNLWLKPIPNPRKVTDEQRQAWTTKTNSCFYVGRSWWTEVKLILQRQHLTAFRTSNYLLAAFLAAFFSGIWMGFTWFQMSLTESIGVQDRIGILSITPRMVMWSAMAVAFVNKGMVRLERSKSLYRCSASYFAFLGFLLPLGLVITLAQYLPTYYLSGLRYTPFTAMLTFVGFQYLHNLCYYPVGFLVAGICSTYESAASIIVVLISLVRLFGGFSVNLRNMTPILSWMRFLSPTYYCVTGTAGNEFIGQIIAGQPGEYWLNLYALDMISVIWAAGALFIYWALIMVLGFLAWEYATKPTFNIKTFPPKEK